MRVILNPMARNGTGRRLRSVIERALERRRVDFDVVQTEGPGHAIDLARHAAEAGIARVVAAGGDGTVHEVANGVLGATRRDTAVGLLPIGTGNDFGKMVPGAASFETALETLATGAVAAYDAGCARWDGRSEFFVNAMGTGIDVEVVRGMRRNRFLPGGLIYARALLRALARYTPLAIDIRVDDRTEHRSIMNLAVCNGPCIGGSFRICPDARPDDGLLDVVIIDEMPILRNARMVPRVVRGTHIGRPGVTALRGRSVRLRIRDDGPLFFQLDGELREATDGRTGIEISLDAARLNVIREAAAGAFATGER